MANRGGGRPSGGASAASSSATASGSGAPTESDAYSVPVEVLGVIYIYNKPDLSKLGGGAPAPGTPGQ